MSSLFSKPKTPDVPPSSAIPTALDPSVSAAGENARKKMLARLGRQGTILTGLGGQQQQLGSVA